MNRKSNGRIFGIAIASSIAVHLAFACVIHVSPVTAAPEQKPRTIVIVERLRKPKPTPKPTSTPRPQVHKVQPHARPSRAVRPHINPVHVHNPVTNTGVARVTFTPGPVATPGAGDIGTGNATAAPSAPPAPSPTPKPACSAPDIPAKAVDAVTPETPADSPVTNVVAKVEVTLDASGTVVGTKIYTSTGYSQLDRAALEAARESRYAPEERDCKNIPGSYLFTVDFQN